MNYRDRVFASIHEDRYEDLLHLVEHEIPGDFSWNSCIYGKTGDSPMHVAARVGSSRILELLNSKCSMSLEIANFEGKRPLHEAAQFGRAECVEYLINKGVQVDCLKRADWTPLMLASTKSCLQVIRLLVDKGRANLLLVNKDGWTSFHLACREGHVDIVRFFLDKNSQLWENVSHNGRTPLHTAALHGRFEVVKLLIERGDFQIDVLDNCGTTPFMDAIRAGHLDIADWFLRNQLTNPDTRDKMGRKAIHLAAQAGVVGSLELLIKAYGEDPNAVATLDGARPLHCAAREGQGSAVKILRELGADPSLRDKSGRTPLDLATQCRHLQCAEFLQDF